MNKLLFILSILCLFSCRKYELKHAHENINTLNKDIIQREPELIGNDSVKMTGYLRIGKRNKIYAVIVDSLPFINGDNSKLIGKEVTSLKGKFANEIAADFYQVNENVLYHSFFVDAQNTHPLQNGVAYPIKSNSYLFEITEGRISFNLGGAVQDKELKFNTISPLNITNTGAKLRLAVTRLNPSLTIQQFGFYIGKNTISSNSDRAVIIGVPFSIADFNSEEASLESGTTYFYRAFVNTDKGNYLGDVIKFKTLSVDNTARLETIASIDSNNYKIDLRCNVLNMKQTVIKSCGFVYDTVAVPSINQTKLVSNLANFKDSINNYLGNKTYYIRSFIETNEGVVYGNQEIRHTTIRLPEVVTNTSTNLNGSITNTGGGTITQKGFCWSLSSDPSINDSILVNINSSNTFSNTLPLSLLPNTTYYFRAFAINEKGIGYGTIKAYLTSKSKPILLTDLAVTNITSTAAMLNNTVLTNGGANITRQGFCYATSPNPSVSNSKQLHTPILQTGLVANNIVSLLPSTTYYVRAFSTNSYGTSYSNEISFTTLSGLPVLNSNNTSSSISYSSFSFSYGIKSIGGAPITASGIIWSASNSNPTLLNASTFSIDNSPLQTVTKIENVYNLSPSTTYYVTSYATNSYGTVYSNVMTVTTLSGLADISTNAATLITASGFIANATIVSNKGFSITNSGFVWSTNPNPTTSVSTKTSNNTTYQTGNFASSITGLTPQTIYYVRSYAINQWGTSYGNELSVTTIDGLAVMITGSPASISFTNFTANASITNNKGYNITNSGFVYSTNPNPTTNLSTKTSNGSTFQSGNFSFSITGLIPKTTYYVRAYVINQWGTSYGNELSVTTIDALAVVKTSSPTSISFADFITNGSITDNKGIAVSNSGFVWSTNPNPTTSLSTKTSNGSTFQSGNFSFSITGLIPQTTYYVRAYVINQWGTSYGNEITVNTLSGIVTLNSNSVTVQTFSSVLASANIVDNGGTNIFNAGFVWDTNPNPTISLSTNINYSSTYQSGIFNGTITGLLANTTYYVRPYATNQFGTVYGIEKIITTLKGVPVLQTDVPVISAKNTISATGSILSNSDASVLTKGICYSTSPNQTYQSATKVFDASNSTAINTAITNLLPGVKYYFKAFASNSIGIGLGNEVQILMPSALSTVINKITIVKNGFQINSTVSAEPNLESKLTKRGLLYDTIQDLNFKTSNLLISKTSSGVINDTIKLYLTNKTYYLKSFVINNADTTYSLISEFKTFIPIVTTRAVSYWGVTGGIVSDSGSSKIIERGIIYSTNPNPTIENAITIIGSDSLTYTNVLKNVKLDSIYYVKAYCKNLIGTGYGDVNIDTVKIIEWYTAKLYNFNVDDYGNVYTNNCSEKYDTYGKKLDFFTIQPPTNSNTCIFNNSIFSTQSYRDGGNRPMISISQFNLNGSYENVEVHLTYVSNFGAGYFMKDKNGANYLVNANFSQPPYITTTLVNAVKVLKNTKNDFIFFYDKFIEFDSMMIEKKQINLRDIHPIFRYFTNFAIDKRDNLYLIGSGGTTWYPLKGIVIYDSNYQLLKTYDFANYLEDPSYIEVDSNNRIFILDRLLNSAQKSRIVVMSTKYQ